MFSNINGSFLGGTIGLFTGMSLLSMMEIFFWLTRIETLQVSSRMRFFLACVLTAALRPGAQLSDWRGLLVDVAGPAACLTLMNVPDHSTHKNVFCPRHHRGPLPGKFFLKSFSVIFKVSATLFFHSATYEAQVCAM